MAEIDGQDARVRDPEERLRESEDRMREMQEELERLRESEEGAQELREELDRLRRENSELVEISRRNVGERRYLEAEVERLEREVGRLKSELARMRAPPQIIGTVRDVITPTQVIVKSTTGPDFLVTLSESVDPATLTPGSRVALSKQNFAILEKLTDAVDPAVLSAEIIGKPPISYDDVGGLREQILEIKEAVEDPLLKKDLFIRVGIDPPKGVLLVGPPGTGKTLLAKAVANRTNATFVRMVGSELVQKYIGEGARLVRELFEMARKKAPSIVFIDELDAIGARRMDMATSGDREVQRTLMQLLAELDGFNPLEDVRIIGATNRPDIIDEALLRPGRFDRIIEIPLPDIDGRTEILKIHTKRMSLDKGVDLRELANRMEGFSGAQLKAVCTEAGMFAIREERDKVFMRDFDKAKDKVHSEFDLAHKHGAGAMFA